MSNDYFKYLEGSPYINEGFFNSLSTRAKAKYRSAGQQASAMFGKSIKPLDQTKLESMFDDFSKHISTIFSHEFNEKDPNSIYYKVKQNIPLTDRSYTNRWNSIQAFVKAISNKIPPIIPKPPVIPSRKTSVSESILSRPISITDALRTNDYRKIVDTYYNYLKKSVSDFITTMANEVGISEEDVLGWIRKNRPEMISGLRSFLPKKEKNKSVSTGEKKVDPKQENIIKDKFVLSTSQASKAEEDSKKVPENISHQKINEIVVTNDEVVLIIDKSIDVVIDAIQNDKTHFNKMLEKVTDYEKRRESRMTQNIKEEEEETHTRDFIAGEIIYNIASKYRKHRRGLLQLESKINTNIPSANIRKIDFFWNIDERANIIIAKIFKVGVEKYFELSLYRFYDHDGLLNGTIEEYINSINPYLKKMYDASTLTESKNQINQKLPTLNKYITGIGFKKNAAEFKSSISKDPFQVFNVEDGTIMDISKPEKPKYDKQDIIEYLSEDEDESIDFAAAFIKFCRENPAYVKKHPELEEAARDVIYRFNQRHGRKSGPEASAKSTETSTQKPEINPEPIEPKSPTSTQQPQTTPSTSSTPSTPSSSQSSTEINAYIDSASPERQKKLKGLSNQEIVGIKDKSETVLGLFGYTNERRLKETLNFFFSENGMLDVDSFLKLNSNEKIDYAEVWLTVFLVEESINNKNPNEASKIANNYINKYSSNISAAKRAMYTDYPILSKSKILNSINSAIRNPKVDSSEKAKILNTIKTVSGIDPNNIADINYVQLNKLLKDPEIRKAVKRK